MLLSEAQLKNRIDIKQRQLKDVYIEINRDTSSVPS